MGGAVFTLCDFALAIACNIGENPTVSVESSIHYMLTGGEPLVRKHDVVRLAEKHNDCLFNVFTNASLVDQAFCDDVKRVGNIIFSVSLESYEAGVNDGRRGNGSFDEVMTSSEKC